MNKPEKKEVYKPTDEQVGNGAYYDLREIYGYNEACVAYEIWLKEVASVERLEKIITDYISSCITPISPSVKGLAKVISKEIK